MIWGSVINMKYIKTYEQNNNTISITENNYSQLKDILKSKLDIIGLLSQEEPLPNLIHSKIKRLVIKMDFRKVEYSILWFLCKAILDPKVAADGFQVVPLSIKWLSTLDDYDIILSIAPEGETTTKVFNDIINGLIKHIGTASDSRICIGNSSEYQYPIFKETIINYLNSLLNHNIELDNSVYQKIKEYIGNSNKPHAIFAEIQKNNPFLFSKLKDYNTSVSADLGGLGFND